MKDPHASIPNGGMGSPPLNFKDPALEEILNKSSEEAYQLGFAGKQVDQTVSLYESCCEQAKEQARYPNLSEMAANECFLKEKEIELESTNPDDIEDTARKKLRPQLEKDMGIFNALENSIKLNGGQLIGKLATANVELKKLPPFVRKHSKTILTLILALASAFFLYDGFTFSDILYKKINLPKGLAYGLGFSLSASVFVAAEICAIWRELGNIKFSKYAFYAGTVPIIFGLFARLRFGELIDIFPSIGMASSYVIIILGLFYLQTGLSAQRIIWFMSHLTKKLDTLAQQFKLNEGQKLARISKFENDVQETVASFFNAIRVEITQLKVKIETAKIFDQEKVDEYNLYKSAGKDFIQSKFQQGQKDRDDLNLDNLFT